MASAKTAGLLLTGRVAGFPIQVRLELESTLAAHATFAERKATMRLKPYTLRHRRREQFFKSLAIFTRILLALFDQRITVGHLQQISQLGEFVWVGW